MAKISKESIKVFLKNRRGLYRFGRWLFNAVRHNERLSRTCSFGPENEDKTIFLIRPNSEDGVQGLLSLFIQSIAWVDFAKRKGYIPYIDYLQYKTQYYDGKHNVWEDYFTQPSDLTYSEIFRSRKVIFSGPMLFDEANEGMFEKEIFTDPAQCRYCHDLIWNNISLSQEAKEIVEREAQALNIDSCIGLYLRGTDYTKMRPTGEHVQPDMDQFLEKVDEFTAKYPDAPLFLVTEDREHYDRLKAHCGDRLRIVSFDSFVDNYDGKDFLSKSDVLSHDTKKRGMDYLVKMVLLSRCRYLVSSITMGSIAAYAMNGNRYEDSYIFDLGLYS